VLPARIAELRRFDLLVSDSAPDQALQDWLTRPQHCVVLHRQLIGVVAGCTLIFVDPGRRDKRQVLPARIAELRRFDLLVSDSAPDQALQDWLAQQAMCVTTCAACVTAKRWQTAGRELTAGAAESPVVPAS
jgi:DeoR/GlpR family transcriptional regulator of sugar metabolism